MNLIEFPFLSKNKSTWINQIYEYTEHIKSIDIEESEVSIHLSDEKNAEQLEPFHIVLLACFIEHIKTLKCSKIMLYANDPETYDVIANRLHIDRYFEKDNPSCHEESEDDKILNLWKVVNTESYSYSLSVSSYLSRQYFSGLDTSGLSSAMNEIYANIADHSKSDGNAYSYISYNPVKKKIFVAACDFGMGIANTLRSVHDKYKSDSDALRDSVNIGVTARSTKRNKGMGLDNIISAISTDDYFRIVSNKSLLFCFGNKNNIKTYDIDPEFKGTLIYFELSTDSFPVKEIEDEIIIM